MDSTPADRIVLVDGPGPEALAAALIMGVALAGITAAVMMARRGRVEAWSLVGLFGLALLGAMLALAHLPTRLVVDRAGVDLAFWALSDRRPWAEIAAAEVRRGPLGLWVSFSLQTADPPTFSLWSRWPGVLVPDPPIEPRPLAMRMEAWRLATPR